MLHPRMSEEIRNDKRFTFTGFIERVCASGYLGDCIMTFSIFLVILLSQMHNPVNTMWLYQKTC